MKVLLINPGQYSPLKGYNYPINSFQPSGLGYLAGNLLKSGFQVSILDVLAEGYNLEEIRGEYKYIGLSVQEIKRRIKKYNPDVVGISILFTAQSRSGHEMAEIVKSTDKKTIVVVGGSYPTTYASEVLDDRNIDFVVLGEGEVTLLEMMKKIEKGDVIKILRMAGLAYRDDKRVKINKRRPPLVGLDKYSLAWDLLPMEKYFEAAKNVKSSRCVSTFGKRWATIFTSRGCPYTCTFCVGHEVMGRQWRSRTPENVISEMGHLIEKYGIEHFDIEDDNFTLNIDRAKRICDMIIEKGWKIEWSTPNGIRADKVDEELIKKMKKSGCVRTIVAPESGDQWVINNLMKKRINLRKVKQVVSWCKKHRIAVDSFFLLGMPGEKKNNLRNTIAYAKKLRKAGINECLFGIVVPHKGTEVHRIVTENGWLRLPANSKGILESLAKDEAMIETPYLSINDLREFQKKANKVNSLLPLYRFRLIATMAIKSPDRFFRLLLSDIIKRLGYASGKLGV